MKKNKMLMVQEEHFVRDSSGNIFAKRVLSNQLLSRYTTNLEKLYVLARFEIVDKYEGIGNKITLSNVEFVEIGEFRGPKELIKKFPSIVRQFKIYCKKVDVVYFRTPSLLSLSLYRFTPKSKKIGIEFIMGAHYLIEKNDPISRIMNRFIDREAKRIAKKANATLYVTKKKLQEVYPPSKNVYNNSNDYFTVGISDVELDKNYIVYRKPMDINKKTFVIICVGFMDTYRKGQHILINAIYLLTKKGFDVELKLVGDGKKKKEFEKLASKLNILEKVSFLGVISTKDEMFYALESADIFVLPSKLEGLPRVILEAMSTGLPVIASNVDGNSELVQQDLIVDDFSADSYAKKIEMLICNANYYNKCSRENTEKAKEYLPNVLDPKRELFYYRLGNL